MGPSTFSRIKRGAVVGAGVLAVSLASAMPANAALGGAKPGQSTLRPNLVSVSVAGSQATFRFDKPLENNVTNATALNFQLRSNATTNGGLATNGVLPGTSAQVNGSTVTVGFGPDADLTKLTAGSVNSGAVTLNDNPGRTNYADAAPVTSTTSGDGTRGRSAAPRLERVERNGLTGLTYIFDRELAPVALNPANFAVSSAGAGPDTNAAAVPGGSATVESDRVEVVFANGTSLLNSAVAAYVGPDAVLSATPAATAGLPAGIVGRNLSDYSRANLPGKEDVTARADLLTATLVPNSLGFANTTRVQFGFDDAPVGAINANAFTLTLANGQRVQGVQATPDPNSPRTVEVTFDTIANGAQEYAVGVSVAANAFATQSVAVPNGVSPANEYIGGNDGATAAGFTVAPEVLGVRKTNTNEITVTVDTRLGSAPLSGLNNVDLLSANGEVLPGSTNLAPGQATAYQGQPGSKQIIYNVASAANVTDAVSVRFGGSVFTGKLGSSLPQVVGF